MVERPDTPRARQRLVDRLRERGIRSPGLLHAIRHTPRHKFIEPALRHRAYEDTALPIGRQQTISQPYVVARMTELLLPGGNAPKVLEIGTGSGYQTAILAQLCDWVFTVERIGALRQSAKALLEELKLRNISYLHADGQHGWAANQPYPAILVTAALPEVPQALLDQLGVGGRLVAPIGDDEAQILQLITRTEQDLETQSLDPVRFVPMRQGHTP